MRAIICLLFGLVWPCQANYVLSLSSAGLSQRTVRAGSIFTLDAVLISNATDRINSTIFRLEFSQPGLVYRSYTWLAPFDNDTGSDDSKPRAVQLPQPLGQDTLKGPEYPEGVVDVELSNVVDSSARFTSGQIVRLSFQVPSGHPPGLIVIRLIPDAFANGFVQIPTTVADPFELTVELEGELRIEPGTRISWPASRAGSVLEGAPTITGPWTRVDEAPVLEDDRQVISMRPEGPARFFRLRTP